MSSEQERKRRRERARVVSAKRKERIEREGGKREANLATCADAQGTTVGHSRHLNAGEEFCDPCREAHNERNRNYRKENRDYLNMHESIRYDKLSADLQDRIKLQGGRMPGKKATCAAAKGERGGYKRHYWAAEYPCDDCRLSENTYQWERRNINEAALEREYE